MVKNMLVLFGFIALVTMSSCKKDEKENTPTVDNKVLISEIFNAGMTWNTQTQALKSTVPINIQVDNTVTSPKGGNIHVIGSVTGSMSVDDVTGNILGGTMLIGLTETINDYAVEFDGETFTMTGVPYVSLTGTFTIAPGGGSFGTASSMQIGGGFKVVGPGFDKTINIQITIIINSNGSGGHVSGQVGGEPVDYTF
jgi:hypothetical protein